jgi:hypothetical protein
MSNYFEARYHPVEKVVRTAMMLDDYFGKYQYGVQFDTGGPVFQPKDCDIPLNTIFVRLPKRRMPPTSPAKAPPPISATRTHLQPVPTPQPAPMKSEAQGNGVFMGAGTIDHKILHSWLL